jgi:hypothetical protein
MIFWLVLKLEISYRVCDILKGFGFFLEGFFFFEDYIFLHGEIFEFPSFFFCLKILFWGFGKRLQKAWLSTSKCVRVCARFFQFSKNHRVWVPSLNIPESKNCRFQLFQKNL